MEHTLGDGPVDGLMNRWQRFFGGFHFLGLDLGSEFFEGGAEDLVGYGYNGNLLKKAISNLGKIRYIVPVYSD